LENSKYGDIDPNGYFQRFSLNISLILNYGIRIDRNVSDEMLNEGVTVERELANLRGTGNNWADYVPLLRYGFFDFGCNSARGSYINRLWLKYKMNADEFRQRRDNYVNEFLRRLKQKTADGTDNPYFAGNVLKDPEAKLSEYTTALLPELQMVIDLILR